MPSGIRALLLYLTVGGLAGATVRAIGGAMFYAAQALWRRRNGGAVRTRSFQTRPGLWTEIGIVLLIIGVGGLIALSAGVIKPSPIVVIIIFFIIASAVSPVLCAAIATLIAVAVAALLKPQRKA